MEPRPRERLARSLPYERGSSYFQYVNSKGRCIMLARRLTAVLLVGLFILGCSRSGLGPEGEVSGKVTYKSKPLPGGVVIFMSPKGHTFSGIIDPEGNYKLNALAGETRIAVDNRILEKRKAPPLARLRPPPGMNSGPPSPTVTGTYVPLPKHYANVDTSSLKYTVKPGSQTHNIELSANPSPSHDKSRR